MTRTALEGKKNFQPTSFHYDIPSKESLETPLYTTQTQAAADAKTRLYRCIEKLNQPGTTEAEGKAADDKKKEKKTNGLKTKLRRNVTGCREGTEQAVRADQLLLLLSVPVLSLLLSISPYFIPIPIWTNDECKGSTSTDMKTEKP